MTKILIVDDEPVFLMSMALLLEQAGFDVTTAAGAPEAIQAASADGPDALLSDWMLRGEMNGMDLAASLRQTNAALGLVLITGYVTDDIRKSVNEFGRAMLLEKPFSPEQLLEALETCIR